MIKAIKLEGSSMLPLFKPGEIVLVQSFDLKSSTFSFSPGDCVVYTFEGRSLLHRVVAVEESGLLISDDAGRLAPHKVPWSDLTGRVVTSNPLKKGLGGMIYSKLIRLASDIRMRA